MPVRVLVRVRIAGTGAGQHIRGLKVRLGLQVHRKGNRDGIISLFRCVHIAPGLTVNLAKSGPSLSLGVRGAHVTLSSTGIRNTVGLPGSGCFYTSKEGWHSGAHTAPQLTSATPAPPVQHSGWEQVGHILMVVLEAVGIAAVAVLGILLMVLSAAGSTPRRSRHRF